MELSQQEWVPFDILNHNNDLPIILIILNTPIICYETLTILWKKAWLKIAVDGGSNRLYQFCEERGCRDDFIPDLITGDLDSAAPNVIDFYESKGVPVIPTPDQNETDFTKSLRIAVKKLSTENKTVSAIVALADIWGRVDQVFANFATLFNAELLCSVPVFLVNSGNISWLLRPGRHRIGIPVDAMDGYCGLIPLGGPCQDVTTTGLKWNLDHNRLQFGHLVSTSNGFDANSVIVETDNHLLFTMTRPSKTPEPIRWSESSRAPK